MTALPDLPGRLAVRRGGASVLVRRRTIAVGLVAAALTAAVAVVALGRGSYALAPDDVVRALTGGGTRIEHQVVVNLRLPRVLAGVLVGVALGVAGAMTQALARNPLASPDLIGWTDGAAAGAVSLIVLGRPGGPLAGLAGQVGTPLAALAGSVVTAVVIYLLAWKRGVQGFRLVLAGVMVGEVLSGFVSLLLVRADVTAAGQAVVWLSGSLSNRGWADVVPLAVALAVLLPLAAGTSFGLSGLQFGPDTGRALGVRLQRAQLGVVGCAVALVAAAVSTAGPIAFVAFAVPQLAQRLCGGGRPPLAASAAIGALLVTAADLVARSAPNELPVGLVTSMIGAPYLLWVLVRANRGVTR